MLFEAVVLGAVQALTEFLPISSSGHLLLIPSFLGWNDPFLSGLTLSVALHLGTVLALALALWRDWWWLARGVLGRGPDIDTARRVALALVLSTLAVGAIGLPLKDAFEGTRLIWVVAVTLIVFGLILGAADRWGPNRRSFGSVRLAPWLVVGLSQIIALVPGVSRSGITMTAGRALGIERHAAARYSMLLVTPVVLGAGLVQLVTAAAEGHLQGQVGPLLAGAAVATVVGALAVRWLLWFVARHSLLAFALYRVALGVATLGLLAARGDWPSL